MRRPATGPSESEPEERTVGAMSPGQAVIHAAKEYLLRGWQVVPVRPRSKKPTLSDWPNLQLKEEELAKHLKGSKNIGLLLGETSGGLTDIDLDVREAVAVADAFLPVTGMVHGRESKPRSHRWYTSDSSLKTEKFVDEDGTCLVELRSTGSQTIVPPSVHPSGETLSWADGCSPAAIDGDLLRRQVHAIAACSLIARHWPAEGSRHQAALALAGGLLRAGWSEDEVTRFVVAAARVALDKELADRERGVRDTTRRFTSGEPTTGWPRLVEIFGQGVVTRLREFLEVSIDFEEPQFVRTVATTPWPGPLADEALYGLCGEVVRTFEPYSEADPVALLVHFIATFGAAVGEGPHVWAGDARHTLRIWPVVVGKTSKGRKGSSWTPNRRVFELADPAIVGDRMANGLSTGEGLISHVRDPIEKYELVGRGAGRHREWTMVDPGIEDKRLLVLEEEFASVLRVIQREGSTLSPVCRRAWDRGNLQSLTKNSPVRATGAHIVIMGHVSRDELLRYLDRTEIASGFANRFIYVCSRRARVIPSGNSLPDSLLHELAECVGKALQIARGIGRMSRDAAAEKIWEGIYGPLSDDRPGLLGAVTNRAEAQVLRLSMMYAAIGGSAVIRPAHLLAAMAVWTYAEQSAAWIFGDSLGDPLADEILRALRTQGPLTRNEIYDRWGKHRGVERLGHALGLLLEHRKARFERRNTPGRPVEIWTAT
jgi:hypothetical protein